MCQCLSVSVRLATFPGASRLLLAGTVTLKDRGIMTFLFYASCRHNQVIKPLIKVSYNSSLVKTVYGMKSSSAHACTKKPSRTPAPALRLLQLLHVLVAQLLNFNDLGLSLCS